jgi:hypothetical protein
MYCSPQAATVTAPVIEQTTGSSLPAHAEVPSPIMFSIYSTTTTYMHNCLMFIMYKMLRHKRTTFCYQVPAFSTETPISPGALVYSSHDVSTEDNDTGDMVRIPQGTEIKVIRICNPSAADTTVFFGECLASSEWFLGLSQRSAYSSCTCRFSIGGVRMDAPITPATAKTRAQWGTSRIACTVNRITDSFSC